MTVMKTEEKLGDGGREREAENSTCETREIITTDIVMIICNNQEEVEKAR